MTTMTTAAEPDGVNRIASLDILRGLAILAILFMNINDMGGSLYAFMANDIRHLGWSAADQVAWLVREVLANGTARCLLEMLFGAGMVILTDRAAQATAKWRVFRGYAWRNIVLWAFGMIHVYILMWPGDILHTYGIAALLAVLFRRWRPHWLLAVGLILALLQLGGGGYSYLTVPAKRAEVARLEAAKASGQALTKEQQKTLAEGLKARAARDKNTAEMKAKVAAEDKARSSATGTAGSWFAMQWSVFNDFQSQFLEILFVWEALSTMLIGAALYKWGILQGLRSRRFYIVTLVLAYGIGLTSRLVDGLQTMEFNNQPQIGWAMHEVARLATTLGHVALVQLLLGSAAGARMLRPFEAAGRTALTIYILQTIICLWILYPPFALGLYGTQGWAALMLTALAINAVLLWWANWWVKDHRIAPVEWAWRSIIERRRLPIRRGGATRAPGLSPQPV